MWAFSVAFVVFQLCVTAKLILSCSSSKKTSGSEENDDRPWKMKKKGAKGGKGPKKGADIKKPKKDGVAGTFDPNYQTLAAVGGDCFGPDKAAAGGPKPPAQGGVAGTHDPNYQTLAGVGGDCFGTDKKAGAGRGGGGAAGGPKPPAQGGVAGTFDPNYQTLAGVGGDCFGADKKGAARGGRGGGGGTMRFLSFLLAFALLVSFVSSAPYVLFRPSLGRIAQMLSEASDEDGFFDVRPITNSEREKKSKRSRCLINGGLSQGCDMFDAIFAKQQANKFSSFAGPGKK